MPRENGMSRTKTRTLDLQARKPKVLKIMRYFLYSEARASLAFACIHVVRCPKGQV